MHVSDPKAFAAVLRNAADSIAQQPAHPGQSMPGVWSLDASHPFEVIIGIIAAAAIARACAEKGYNLDRALASYLIVAKQVSLQPVGAPDKVAAEHLRAAAECIEPVLEDA